MKITYDDCVTMHNALVMIKQPEFADIKDLADKDDFIYHIDFAYAIAYNKKKLQDIVEALDESSQMSDEYKEYLDERDKILQKFSVKDPDGAPRERVERLLNNQVRRSYIVPDLADSASSASKAIKKVEDKYKDVIDARKKQEKEFKDHLREEVKDLKLRHVPVSRLPKGLQPSWYDGLIFMIDGEPESK